MAHLEDYDSEWFILRSDNESAVFMQSTQVPLLYYYDVTIDCYIP